MTPSPETSGHGPQGHGVQGALHIEDAVNETCPWSGKPVVAEALTLYNGAVVGFCNTGCRDKFAAAVRAVEAALQARRVERAGQEP